jgi:hypothetical protein
MNNSNLKNILKNHIYNRWFQYSYTRVRILMYEKMAKFESVLIAPCGMNCGICKSYLAYTRGIPKKRGKVTHCLGCLPRNKNCFIKRGCKNLRKERIKFCFECRDMPCENLDRLDRRYRKRYNMSMVENLNELKEKGMEQFLKNQEEKYRCQACGDFISVHDGKCYLCESKRTS